MRVLYGPVMKIFGFKKPKAPAVVDYAAQKAKEDKAAEEAQRKARAEAAARQGSAATLLTPSDLEDEFGSSPSKRKTLFGG